MKKNKDNVKSFKFGVAQTFTPWSSQRKARAEQLKQPLPPPGSEGAEMEQKC